VDTDVEAREANERRQHEERGRKRGQRESENDRRGEARGGMTRWEGRGRRRRHEHVDPVQPLLRAATVGRELYARRSQIREHDNGQNSEREARAPEQHRSDNAERDPQQAMCAGVGDADEQWIEPVDAVLDDPALETLIERGQGAVVVVVTVTVSLVAATGTIVLVSVVAPCGAGSVAIA
jgi:hypothetical protein